MDMEVRKEPEPYWVRQYPKNLYQMFLLFARCEAGGSGKTGMIPGLKEGALRLVWEVGILYPEANHREEIKNKVVQK